MGTWKVSPTTSPAQNIYKTIPANWFATEFRANFSAKAILVSFQKGSNSGNDVHPHFFH